MWNGTPALSRIPPTVDSGKLRLQLAVHHSRTDGAVSEAGACVWIDRIADKVTSVCFLRTQDSIHFVAWLFHRTLVDVTSAEEFVAPFVDYTVTRSCQREGNYSKGGKCHKADITVS